MYKIKYFFLIFLTMISFSVDFQVNDETSFVNAINNSNSGDKIILNNSILVSQYYGSVSSVNLKGVTIEGNNNKLEIINLPISLSGDSIIKNVKLNMSSAGGITLNTNALNNDDKQAIYANGYNLTLDSVTTDYENRRNTAPTIFMGSKEGNINLSNKLEIKNSDESNTKFKDIFAGNENGSKTGKSEIILDENVRITGYNDSNNSSENSSLGKSTLKLNNKEIDSDLEVSVVNKSRWISGYDTKGNENVDIELINNQMFSPFKSNGKLKNLTVKGNSILLIQDTPLQVENLKLVSFDNSNPEIKVSHPSASVKIDNLNSNSEENKVSFYDSVGSNLASNTTASFEFKNLEGSFKREGGSNTNIRSSSNSSNNNGTYTSNVDNNEEVRLNNKKTELSSKVDRELSNLNENQKNKLKESINSKNNISDLENLENTFSNLNQTMSELKKVNEEINSLKNDNSYSKIQDGTKTEVENLINKFNEFSDIEISAMQTLKTKLDNLVSKVSSELNNAEEDNEDDENSSNDDTQNSNIANKKEELKRKIENFSNLIKIQKEKLKEEVDMKNEEELASFENMISKLNEKMSEILVKKNELENLKNNEKYEQIKEELKSKVDNIINKFNDYETINTEEKLDSLKKEIEETIFSIEFEFGRNENTDKKPKMDLSKYSDYLTLFNYNNTDIENNFDKNTYFNFNLGKNDKNTLNELPLSGGFNLGFNKNIINDMKIGSFLEYEKNKAHHIALGLNLKYKEYSFFTRYRLAIYKELLNHNFDNYFKYNKEFKIIDNLSIYALAGAYISYSNNVDIDEVVKLDNKISFLLDLESKLEYSINKIKIYTKPGLKFGYNKSKIYEKNDLENILEANNDIFMYYLDNGIKKEFENGLNMNFNILLKGNEKADFRVKTNMGISYNWE